VQIHHARLAQSRQAVKRFPRQKLQEK